MRSAARHDIAHQQATGDIKTGRASLRWEDTFLSYEVWRCFPANIARVVLHLPRLMLLPARTFKSDETHRFALELTAWLPSEQGFMSRSLPSAFVISSRFPPPVHADSRSVQDQDPSSGKANCKGTHSSSNLTDGLFASLLALSCTPVFPPILLFYRAHSYMIELLTMLTLTELPPPLTPPLS